jgi:ABC-type Na+ transport system ATPase subunit NatA
MIEKIEIHNYRSCYSTSIDFNGHVCALVGKNGVGKTNILKCIQWLSSSVIASERLIVRHTPDLRRGLSQTTVRVRLPLDSNVFDYLVEVPPLINEKFREGDGLTETLTIRVDCNASRLVFKRKGAAIEISGRNKSIGVDRWTPCMATLLSALSVTDPLRGYLDEMASFLRKVRYCSVDELSYQDVCVTDQDYADWLAKFASDGNPTDSILYRLIFMWENDRELFKEFQALIGPDGLGVVAQVQIISQECMQLLNFLPSAQMGGFDSDRRFGLDELSAGTRRVIQIVLSLLFDKPVVMLIERPEDSLHPGLLRKLIGLLRSYFNQAQIIFETHSSQVVDMLRPEEVLIVTALEGRTEVSGLTSDEASQAERFLKNEGSLSEFLETLDESSKERESRVVQDL